MDLYRSEIIFACVFAYMVLCICVGLWAFKRTKSTEEFFMAGRSLGVWVTALALFSSTLSGFGFVGGPGLVYNMGSSSFWMIICSPFGFCIAFYLLGKRLRLFAQLRNSISLPDAVAARYNSEAARFFTALAILLGVLGYLGTQIMAMSTILREILNSVDYFPVVSLEVCMVISVAVLVFYCVTGGIVASVYTDLIQGSIMIIAAVLIFATCLSVVDGGIAGMSQTIMSDDREAAGPWGSQGIMSSLSWYFLFAVGLAGQPHIITKMMMTRRLDDNQKILPLSIASFTFAALLWIGIGLAMRTLVLQGVHPELANPDDSAAQFLQNYAHPLLAGIVFAALFAAIMSTADGFLNIAAAAIVHDIPKALFGKPIAYELAGARIVTLLIAIASAVFVLVSGENLVALLGAFGWGTFAATLVPVVAIGFNWHRGTALAANTAIVVSLLIIFCLKVFDVSIPYAIDGGAIALLVSLILYFTISLASKPPLIDDDIDRVMRL